MSKKNIVIGLLLVLLLAAGIGYYFGYDHGWERNQDTQQPQTTNFSESGILMYNAQGLKPDVWYLHYERPDGSGRKVELSFPDGNRPSTQGQRVKVEGNISGDIVTVVDILDADLNLPDVTQTPLRNSEVYGYYGTATLTGYLKVDKRVCNPGDMCGETVDYATFVFDKSDNPAIYDLINSMMGNSFVSEGGVGLGCYQKDKSRIYSINDADTGTIESTITGSDLTKLLASSKQSKVQMKLTKAIYTSGRGAPDCYSHFRSFDVL